MISVSGTKAQRHALRMEGPKVLWTRVGPQSIQGPYFPSLVPSGLAQGPL